MLKVTMGDSNTSLVEAIERFEPDVKILLVRHPASVAQAVGTASRGVGTLGRARGGELMPRDAVLSRLEWTWAMSGTQWDTVLLFEELLFNPAVARQKLRTAGFSEASLDSMDRMRRSKKDVERFNGKHSRWSRSQRVPSKYARDASNQLVGWDFGGASRNPAQQLQQLRDTFPTSRPSDSMRRKAASLCPLLSAYYSAHHPELDAPPQGGNGKTDAWLVAVQRLYKLVDDRAATFQGDDETPSIAAAHDGVGGRLRTHLRERWIMVALATNTWVRNGVTFNWMASLRRVGVSSFIVVSLDLPTHEALSAIGAPSFFHETHYADVAVGVGASGSSRAYRASLLSYKWKVLAAILKRGVATLLTDVDSVVLRDFRPLLDQSRSHIIGGRGNTKQLLVRLPFLLVRSCVEVLHVLPRLIADIAKYRDDEYALNKLLAGIVAWAEPPLKAQDRFVEGRTFRPVGGGGPLGHASGSATGTGGALDLALRLTLIPNRLLRLYECTKGHPAETALVMHCGNENLTTATGAKQPLVMTRSGQLVEPSSSSSSSSIATSMLTTTAGLSGSTEGGEFARLRLTELGLWMLTPKWRQQFDLIQVCMLGTTNLFSSLLFFLCSQVWYRITSLGHISAMALSGKLSLQREQMFEGK